MREGSGEEMKLKLLGVEPSSEPSVEIDEYIPVTAQWPAYTSLTSAPACLMLDVGASLVEIKTSETTGELVEIVLVDAKQLDSVDADLNFPTDFEPGSPILSIEESADCGISGVRRYSDGLDIHFAEVTPVRTVGSSRVLFRFSPKNELIGISLKFREAEMGRLVQFLH